MANKTILVSLVSLLLITGTLYYFNDQQTELQDFHGNLTPTEHMICRANQFQANDYNNCIMNYRDYYCQGNYYSWLSQYRQDETKFYEYYLQQPEDVKYVVQGWNKTCNTFEHYRRCGEAEKLFTYCVFNGQVSSCAAENQEYIAAAMKCQELGRDVPYYEIDIVQSQCMATIVHLAKGQLAEALACS